MLGGNLLWGEWEDEGLGLGGAPEEGVKRDGLGVG